MVRKWLHINEFETAGLGYICYIQAGPFLVCSIMETGHVEWAIPIVSKTVSLCSHQPFVRKCTRLQTVQLKAYTWRERQFTNLKTQIRLRALITVGLRTLITSLRTPMTSFRTLIIGLRPLIVRLRTLPMLDSVSQDTNDQLQDTNYGTQATNWVTWDSNHRT